MLDVILRTCARVYSLHEAASETKHRLPDANTTKLGIILPCVTSLVKSMNQVDSGLRLIVIDDHSAELTQIQKVVEKCKHPTEFISLEGTGNGASMIACFKWAKDNGKDRLFFVEDDYLHDPACIPEMLFEYDFFKMKLSHEIAFFPYDNIDLYMQPQKNAIPCNIGTGRNRHWRTTRFSTYTFFCSKEILERYWYLFALTEDYGKDPNVDEATTINLIWDAPYKNAGGAFLLSPIPSLALHFHFKDHLSPFIDWKSWWNKNKLKYKRKK